MRRLLNVGRGYPPRLLVFVLATVVVGIPLVAGAALRGALSAPSSRTLVGVGVFFTLALAAELRPVPIDVEGQRLVSLAFVFVVASRMLFGWEWSVLIGAAAIGVAMIPDRVGLLKLSFNSSVYGISAAAASLPNFLFDAGRGYGSVTAFAVVSGATFFLVNVVLVCVAMAWATGANVRDVLADHLRHSGSAFSIMAFIAAQVIIFWELSPLLLILVGAPLFTLNRYQRSTVRSRAALKAATTDSLTGLKNHRAYQEEVPAALEQAGDRNSVVSLCLIDVDRFKQVNDRHGHPAGDGVLKTLATLIEELVPAGGYRLGGDEFAVLLEDGASTAAGVMRELQRGLAGSRFEGVPEVITISCGIATFPEHADDAAALKRRADLALYRSKHNGKNRCSVYEAEAGAQETIRPVLPDLRLHAAEKLVALVDTRDTYVGAHSAAVALLVQGIGRALGLDALEIEQLRIAGLLHDLGKVGIPDRILNKPGLLEPAEEELVRKHPQLAFELLDGYDLMPVDTWILHHHEHWDGGGYPLGLAGEEIPFGSRIILVADAFEAMTTNRTYRLASSADVAMEELHERAGTQFDPIVVSALERHLAEQRIQPGLGVPVAAWSS